MKHRVNPKRVPKGYAAITWFPWLAYYASDKVMTARCKRHEAIHGRQQAEMLVIFFYLWYGIEYLYRRFVKRFSHTSAYRSLSMEKEAREHELDPDYLRKRNPFAWIKYL